MIISWRQMPLVVSADPEEFVAEVGHEAEAPAQGLDVSVQHLARGDIALLDLADPAFPDPHAAGDLCLGKATTAADFSEAPAAGLGKHLLFAYLELVASDSLDLLVADI
jgi:hypothetical protein